MIRPDGQDHKKRIREMIKSEGLDIMLEVERPDVTKVVLEKSIAQHARICIENSEDVFDALILINLLGDDIDYRILRYTKCISKSTFNFVEWIKDDYRKKLRAYLRENFDTVFEDINGYPPED